MSFGYGMGDIMGISGLALQVYSAYKDAPDDYRNISDEVKSLHIIINKAAQHFGSASLSSSSRREGKEVLKGCRNILEDLDALIQKYNNLASTGTSQVLRRIKLRAEDITTMRARLTTNTVLLNGFIQRCDSDLIQERLDSILALHHTISRDSVVSFAGSINTKKAYKKFCKGLFSIGVTADMITEKEKEIQNIFKPQQMMTGDQMDVSTSGDQRQLLEGPPKLPELENSLSAEASPVSTISKPKSWARFGWPPMDFLVGPLVLAAAEAGDLKRLYSTLGYVRDINFANDQKVTALHKAVAKGHKNIVQLLLSKGASFDVMDDTGDTPLHYATTKGHTSIVVLLLVKGASVEARNYKGSTPLHLAAKDGWTSTVEVLLTQGAPIEAINFTNNTPLHLAVQNGHTSTVELFLTKGASIQAMGPWNNTPLHPAALNGYTDIVELLLAKGASVQAIGYGNNTPLHLAAKGGHTSTVELLLTYGAPMEAINSFNNTPLHLAVGSGCTSTVELLLTKGASIQAMGYSDNTPLHEAARNGHTSVVELLLTKGALIEAINTGYCTPLHYAAKGGHSSTVELLVTRGASIQAMGSLNSTRLHHAARSGHTSTVELLHAEATSVEATNNHDNTSFLHLTTSLGHPDRMKLLENKAAELCAQTPSG